MKYRSFFLHSAYLERGACFLITCGPPPHFHLNPGLLNIWLLLIIGFVGGFLKGTLTFGSVTSNSFFSSEGVVISIS